MRKSTVRKMQSAFQALAVIGLTCVLMLMVLGQTPIIDTHTFATWTCAAAAVTFIGLLFGGQLLRGKKDGDRR